MIPVTVITPSMPSRAAQLAECIASVAAQTVTPAAHLISISDPGTPNARHAAQQRNALLSAVTTTWVAALDDDDLYRPSYFRDLADTLGTDADLVYSFPTAEPLPHVNVNGWSSQTLTSELHSHNFICATVCVRAGVLRDVGGWPVDQEDGLFPGGTEFEDHALLIRLAEAGAKFACVPVENWVYRHGPWRYRK